MSEDAVLGDCDAGPTPATATQAEVALVLLAAMTRPAEDIEVGSMSPSASAEGAIECVARRPPLPVDPHTLADPHPARDGRADQVSHAPIRRPD